MFKRFAALTLVIALFSTFSWSSSFANTLSDPEAKAKVAQPPSESASAAKAEAKPNEKLRAAVFKLVADAKAGNVTLPAGPQVQLKMSNNLSKGVKIAIVVGIAVVVLALIANHVKNHLFDCGSRCVL